MKAAIVIPTYWGRKSDEPFNPADAVYDHPTPLDQDGTLARALQSINVLKNRAFEVVVIAAATNQEIVPDVEKKVRNILRDFRNMFSITIISHSFEKSMKRIISERRRESALEDETGIISLVGYSNIRNMCLIAAEILSCDVAVLFDDDEVYEDPYYLDKVFENIGQEYSGQFIGALAGYYLRPEGGYLIPPPKEWWMSEWPMATAMNEAFKIIDEEPRLKPTPFVFGGNMCIHRKVYRKIPFDPNVRRGEDIDYLTNCKFFGMDFLLDNQLSIRHLPPESNVPAWRHFRENIYRFIYAREKIRRQIPIEGLRMVKIEELDPYPGRCMRDDLEDLIFKTCILMGMHYLREGDRVGFEESMRNIQLAGYDAPPVHDPFMWFIDFQSRWETFMGYLASEDSSIWELERI